MATKKRAGLKPRPLSFDEKEEIVKEIIGVEPKYLIKAGIKLFVDVSAMAAQGVEFTGFKHKEHYNR